MATGELALGADGELVLKAGLWAIGKLYYIRRYCDIFNAAMKDKWPTRVYIDLFAGPGRCLIETTRKEIDGSPLVALGCKVPFTHYFFNDIGLPAVQSLERRTSSFGSVVINYFARDCNEVVQNLLPQLPPGSLDFCFIDPTSWQIKFDSIRSLTNGRRMDIAITFHVGSMKRVADNPPRELLDFFPDPSWQEEYKRSRTTGKALDQILLEAYKRGLEAIGYIDIRDFILMKNRRQVPLYHLIFASKHHRGGEFWAKISQRSETGQLRFAL
jgi:three-Cys-motif partner protein